MSERIDDGARAAGDEVAADAVIGAYAVVEPGARIGGRSRIGTHAVIGGDVRIGSDVVVHSGAIVDGDTAVEDGVSIGAGACVGGAARTTTAGEATVVRAGARIGTGATVATGVDVGEHAVVEDGAVVTRSVPRAAVVAGNPASIAGYVDVHDGRALEPVRHRVLDDDPSIRDTAVCGVRIYRLPVARDLRGSLVAGELDELVPFVTRRWFLVFGVPSTDVRGEHAHRACHQFLVCVHGQVHVIADDSEQRQEFVLADNRTGLYLPPMTWGTQYRYSADASLLVLASHPYDPADYIRDYDTFLAEVHAERRDG